MTKCDFCTKSLPNGECWWNSIARESDCKIAIKNMVEALKGNNSEKKGRWNRWIET